MPPERLYNSCSLSSLRDAHLLPAAPLADASTIKERYAAAALAAQAQVMTYG